MEKNPCDSSSCKYTPHIAHGANPGEHIFSYREQYPLLPAKAEYQYPYCSLSILSRLTDWNSNNSMDVSLPTTEGRSVQSTIAEENFV